MNKTLAIIFDEMQSGKVSILLGGKEAEVFSFENKERFEFSPENCSENALVRVTTENVDFTFFLKDVNDVFPIVVKEYKAAVLDGSDKRSFGEVYDATVQKGGKTKIQQFEAEDEETFENAAENTRNMKSSTWLGVSRDIRIFEIGFRGEDMSSSFSASQQEQVMWDYVVPRYHKDAVRLPCLGGEETHYRFMIGRGMGCSQGLSRWLEKGYLPILHAKIDDEDVVYNATYLTALEKSELKMENIDGTHSFVADAHSFAFTQTKEQDEITESVEERDLYKSEETVCFIKIVAENVTKAPKYAFMRLPVPNLAQMPDDLEHSVDYDDENGFGTLPDGRIYMTATVNGEPCGAVESARLLMPGEKAEYILAIPHNPIDTERAKNLIKRDYNEIFAECVNFWEEKIKTPGEIILPEKRIENMLKAGVSHIDLMLYGNEPNGSLAAVVGMYCPIGSESTQIVDCLDSLGESDLAKRSIMFFFDKQHDNGFMQNFKGYMLETGAVLHLLAKHYKATGDKELLAELQPKIKKACEYIINWRNDNKKDEYIGNGYGMISGKVADPEDDFHSFMLNAYAVAGLKSASGLLHVLADAYALEVEKEAAEMKEDIRKAVKENLAVSPLVPYGDGFWRPSIAPWTEYKGPLCLYAEGGSCMTHGTLLVRDSLLGAMWLFPLGVVDPCEEMGEFILNLNTEHFNMRNVGYSQPYYCAHPFAHIKRGEVNSYLKELYNGAASLADRETYTFWEHYFHDSTHKLAEEAMFMQRVRHLLWTEDDKTLSILSMAPRAWFDKNETIKVTNVKSLLGDLSFCVEVNGDKTEMTVNLEINKVVEAPEKVKIRLPHPDKKAISKVTDADACVEGETLVFDGFIGKKSFTVYFN